VAPLLVQEPEEQQEVVVRPVGEGEPQELEQEAAVSQPEPLLPLERLAQHHQGTSY